jgi:hypothetical protein
MSNSYKYIDPDYTYTDPKAAILRNLQDITDQDVLLFFESGAVTKRLQEFLTKIYTPVFNLTNQSIDSTPSA